MSKPVVYERPVNAGRDMENRDSDLAGVLAKYDRLVDWERRDRSAMKVDVRPLRDLLHQLNSPQKKFRTIHIAGTKGKGSVRLD